MKRPFSPLKLEGLPIQTFLEHIQNGNISAKPARLIPVYKTGDEQHNINLFVRS